MRNKGPTSLLYPQPLPTPRVVIMCKPVLIYGLASTGATSFYIVQNLILRWADLIYTHPIKEQSCFCSNGLPEG